MTGTATYASIDELKEHCTIPDSLDDSRITDVGKSASRLIDQFCGRPGFDKDTVATARYFRVPEQLGPLGYPNGRLRLWDFWESSSVVLKTDNDGDGVYETTWAAGDFYLEPIDGFRNGIVGWPFEEVIPTVLHWWPLPWPYGINRRPQIEVTAKWGWANVPDAVKRATLTLAARLFAEPSASFGIDPGSGLWIGKNRMGQVEDILNVYRNYSVVTGVA